MLAMQKSQDPLYSAITKNVAAKSAPDLDYMKQRIKRQQGVDQFTEQAKNVSMDNLERSVKRKKELILEQARANRRKKRAGFLGSVGGIIGGAAGFAVGGPMGAAAGYGAGQAIGGGMS
jgi:uncharacterized protein YcfJ